mmetsp:Transcript_37219/g.97472  ORF Transcript_37219/g.97472 Transcript_37219/m.97472 type:complete len:816 (-) Transcript_37219:299-2746(-)
MGERRHDRRRPAPHGPPVELPSTSAQNFLDEAKVRVLDKTEARKKFDRYAEGNERMTIEQFALLMDHYDCCPSYQIEQFFHAFNRNGIKLGLDDLAFDDFLQGIAAADPSTVHILNSFTGYERSQYIFDFFDVNRTRTLEFAEFARLIAECQSLASTSPQDEQVRRLAIEKARDLGCLEDAGSLLHFTCIKFKKFYEFVQYERLRGTSRLFRFNKSLVKQRNGPAQDVDDEDGPGAWTEILLDLEQDLSASIEEYTGREVPDRSMPLAGQQKDLRPYGTLAAAPPRPPPTASIQPGDEYQNAAAAQAIAKTVVQTALARKGSSSLLSELLPENGSVPEFSLVTPQQLITLCTAAAYLFAGEETVVETVATPTKVFGSLHGQLPDLFGFFNHFRGPTTDEEGDLRYTSYVFLGDYVDRGRFSLEVVAILFALKVLHPDRITLLRGSHENRNVNYHLGFRQECEARIAKAGEGLKCWDLINRTFEYMPLACIVERRAMCMHNCVVPNLTADALRRIRRPLTIPHPSQPRPPNATAQERATDQLLQGMFCAPLVEMKTWNGPPGAYGVEDFSLDEVVGPRDMPHMMVASRYMYPMGYNLALDGRLATLTSCVNYCDAVQYDAAIMTITKDQHDRLCIDFRMLSQRQPDFLSAMVGATSHLKHAPPSRWPKQQRDLTPNRCVKMIPCNNQRTHAARPVVGTSIRRETGSIQLLESGGHRGPPVCALPTLDSYRGTSGRSPTGRERAQGRGSPASASRRRYNASNSGGNSAMRRVSPTSGTTPRTANRERGGRFQPERRGGSANATPSGGGSRGDRGDRG